MEKTLLPKLDLSMVSKSPRLREVKSKLFMKSILKTDKETSKRENQKMLMPLSL
jgi:hypothetical protein